MRPLVSSSELVAGRGQFCTAGRAGGVGLQRHYAAPGLAAAKLAGPGHCLATLQLQLSLLCWWQSSKAAIEISLNFHNIRGRPMAFSIALSGAFTLKNTLRHYVS